MSYQIFYKDCPLQISGIYKINFPNGKCYIGQSKNIKDRIRHHNNPNNKETLVDQKIKELLPNGKVEKIEILQEIDSNNNQMLNQKEKYYISLFHSLVSENGYNILAGGQEGNLSQVLIKFNQDKAKEIANLILSNPLVRFEEIAQQYNCHINTIKKINCGISPYNFLNFQYPLRTKNESRILRSRLPENVIINILQELRNSTKTMTQIGQQFNLCRNTISDINKGKKQPIKNYDYPARKTRKGGK